MERENILIDTSILIDHLRKQKKDKTIFYPFSFQYNYVISSITELEFSVGSILHNREFAEKLVAKLPVLLSDSASVKTATEIYRKLKSKN